MYNWNFYRMKINYLRNLIIKIREDWSLYIEMVIGYWEKLIMV